jgi:hypothetical protein
MARKTARRVSGDMRWKKWEAFTERYARNYIPGLRFSIPGPSK